MEIRRYELVTDIYNTDKKYNIIYADPPWKYNTWRDGMGTAEKHYPTMKVESIVGMQNIIKNIECAGLNVGTSLLLTF